MKQMDLMKQSTAYALLKKKYREFAAPTVRVLVEGSDLGERYHAALSNVSVELTSEYPASGCSFDLLGEYRPPDSDFDSKGALRLLELGAKVEVKLGYIATETVFYGLITGLDYRFDPEEAPVVHVECMDAKCLLMKTQRLEIFREKRIDRAVQALLGEQPVGGYLKGKQVDPVPGEIKMLAAGMETSYDFLVRQARYAGCEFFLLAGKAYFRKRPAAGQPVMTVSPGEALLSAASACGARRWSKRVTVGGDRSPDRQGIFRQRPVPREVWEGRGPLPDALGHRARLPGRAGRVGLPGAGPRQGPARQHRAGLRDARMPVHRPAGAWCRAGRSV